LTFPRQPGGGYSSLYNGAPFPFTVDWYRYVIYQNPSWDPSTLSFKDISYALKLNVEGSETWNGDLSKFKNRGSKVIHYHGLIDPIISSENSARYYDHVRKTMALTTAQLDDFYRYFRISGQGHCGGGPGASVIGQNSGYASLNGSANVLTAIVDWVERGKAPDTILGTKFKNGTASSGVDLSRHHCRYPMRNRYLGQGDAKVPESWGCEASITSDA
jgi:feruloyl esterase